MPRYFFDLIVDGEMSIDDEGSELECVKVATCEAVRTLAEIAKDVLPQVPNEIGIRVRDERGHHLTAASLKLELNPCDALPRYSDCE